MRIRHERIAGQLQGRYRLLALNRRELMQKLV
jgi:hypothetical protein